jgi:hypothetical protein
MNRKKTFLIIFLVLLIAVIVVVAIIMTQTKGKTIKNNVPALPNNTANSQNSTTTVSQTKPLELEFMTAEEKASFRIGSATTTRIQVLSRDASGKVTAYKIIKTDADILSSY